MAKSESVLEEAIKSVVRREQMVIRIAMKLSLVFWGSSLFAMVADYETYAQCIISVADCRETAKVNERTCVASSKANFERWRGIYQDELSSCLNNPNKTKSECEEEYTAGLASLIKAHFDRLSDCDTWAWTHTLSCEILANGCVRMIHPGPHGPVRLPKIPID